MHRFVAISRSDGGLPRARIAHDRATKNSEGFLFSATTRRRFLRERTRRDDCHKTRRNRGRSRDNTLRSSIGDVIKRTMGRLIGYSNGNTRPEKHRRENDKTVRARSGVISSAVSRGEKIHAGEISLSRSCTTTTDVATSRMNDGKGEEERKEANLGLVVSI